MDRKLSKRELISILVLVFYVLINRILIRIYGDRLLVYSILSLILSFISFFILLNFYKYSLKIDYRYFKRSRRKNVIVGILGVLVIYVIKRLFKLDAFIYPDPNLRNNGLGIILLLLLAVKPILFSVFEELVFRKLIFRELSRKSSKPILFLLLESILYGFFYFLIFTDYRYFFAYSLIGFFLTIVYIASKNMLYSITINILYNFIFVTIPFIVGLGFKL